MSYTPKYPRTLTLSGESLPVWRNYWDDDKQTRPVLIPIYLHGTEAIGEGFTYTVQARTDPGAPPEAWTLKLDDIVGTTMTVGIEIPGRGTFVTREPGGSGANIGACIREISGHVSEARFVRRDERAMVYEFVLRPMLHEAGLGQNYRLFQDMDVLEITREVLRAYPVTIDWRIAGPGRGRTHYPAHDLQRQYWESDARFLQRLWETWGLFYWFGHDDGLYRLVLADTTSAFQPHGTAHETLRYAQATDSRTDEEHIDRFTLTSRQTAGAVTLVDHDYACPRTTPAVKPLREAYKDARDTGRAWQEVYAWGNVSQPLAGTMGLSGKSGDVWEQTQHRARVKMQALRSAGLRASGHGALRGLTVGRTFHLIEHPYEPANQEYVVVATTLTIEETAQMSGAQQVFRCETDFEVQPVGEPFRMPQKTRKPQAGVEYAVVTGPEKRELHTDAMGRIKVQFLADRQGRLDTDSSIWILPVQPWQGTQMGGAFVPRVGAQVMVGYVNGDPDLPFIVGGSVNARKMPAWKLPFNQWISGLRSQMHNGQAANHLALVDTENELQAQLSSDHGTSQLGLGFLRRIAGHAGLQEARGEGFELRTDLWGVLRAAKGLFLNTHARANAEGAAKDAGETLAQLDQAHDLHAGLAELAQQHGAQAPGKNQRDVARAIGEQNADLRGAPTGNPDDFPEFAKPHLTLSSPAGIQSATEGSTHVQSGQNTALSAGRSVSIAAGKSLYASVLESIALFVRKAGFRLIAAAGNIHLHAQTGRVEVIAQKNADIVSADGWVNLTAAKGIRINGGGTVLEISPAGILGFTNGKFLVHAASHASNGPQTLPVKLPMTNVKEAKIAESFVLVDNLSGLRIVNQPYRITLDDGQVIKGKTNDAGETAQVLANEIQFAHMEFFHNDGTENPIAIYRPLLSQPAKEIESPQADEKREVRQIGSFNMEVNDINPLPTGPAPFHAQCRPDNWGMRYSTKAKIKDSNSTKLNFPVAREYALKMADILFQKIQWGKNYFGRKKPELVLENFPLGDDNCKKLAKFILPAIKEALTSPASGPFALPAKAVPTVVVTDAELGEFGISGSFDFATWTLYVQTDMLAELLTFEKIERQQVATTPEEIKRQEELLKYEEYVVYKTNNLLEKFVKTIYHETRHCQQDFWIFAMVQQHADSFSLTPKIGQWPKAGIKKDNNLANTVVSLSASQPIPEDSLAQASIHRMAAGAYVFILALWKRGLLRNEIAGYLPDQRALDAEYDQACQQAKTLLTDVGAGGTSIDIDSMVEDNPDDEAYVSRPWENDAFYCGEIVQYYWRDQDVPDDQSADWCSYRYAYDYIRRKTGKTVHLGGYQ